MKICETTDWNGNSDLLTENPISEYRKGWISHQSKVNNTKTKSQIEGKGNNKLEDYTRNKSSRVKRTENVD